MNPTLTDALVWLLTAAVVVGAVWLAWLLLQKLWVTAAHHLAQLAGRLRAWASTPFVGAGSAGRAAGRAGRAAWTDRQDRPDPAPSPATIERRERWGQTRPGQAAVRAEQGAARAGRAVGRWTGAGTAAVGSGLLAVPGGWRDGVEHVRAHRRRRAQAGPDSVCTDPATGPAEGPDSTGPAEGPDSTESTKGPGAGDGTTQTPEGPDSTETDPAEGPESTGPAWTRGPAWTPEVLDEMADLEATADEKTLTPEPAKGPESTAPVDQEGDPVPGPRDAGEDDTTERTGQAGAPDTEEMDMAEITEFTNTSDLRAEVEELETTAEELAEQVAEFHRRRELIEEKLGAAPFGTRAIAEAAASVSDAKTLEEAQEALAELRRAVDESDALADVSGSLDAKGDVEAFAAV
jgi:hypothetical protein